MLRSSLAWVLCASAAACGDDAGTTTDTTAPDTTDAAADASADATAPADSDVVAPSPELVIMSYNVMCSFCGFDGQDWDTDWDHRLVWIRDTIARHDPDLIGVQELADLDPSHPAQVAAVGGDDGTYGAVFHRRVEGDGAEWDYPDATLYYRTSRFDLVDDGEFWLSDTPDVPYSHGWSEGLSFTRLVVWATLHDKVLDQDLTFATTHFDNNSPNQDHSAPLCLERFAPKAAAGPMIFVGDFNSTPASTAYGILVGGVDGQGFHFDNAYDLAPAAPRIDADDATPPAWDPAERIDHVFLAGATFTVSDWVVDLYTYGDKQQPASDHWAIATTLRIAP